jgi:hypothetical protein
VFQVGPTSTLAVLDDFTEALVAAGATRITTIHPVCVDCGRRRRWKAKTPTGGRCATCQRRTAVELCSVCGITRRFGRRDAQRRAICASCVERLDRREQLDGFTAEITGIVTATGPSIDPATPRVGRAPCRAEGARPGRAPRPPPQRSTVEHARASAAQDGPAARRAASRWCRFAVGVVSRLRQRRCAAGRLPRCRALPALRETLPGVRALQQDAYQGSLQSLCRGSQASPRHLL